MRPKPKEILELENIYKIELSELVEGDIMYYDNRNKYKLDDAGKIIGLNLRENKITRIENLDKLVNLTSLYLYNNQITRIENLDTLVNLTSLSLGGNQITRIENLDTLVKLNDLNLGWNQITRIENLDKLVNLTSLNLDNNQITKIENLDTLANLNDIWLTRNQITRIENLDNLVKLNELYLIRNQITRIENLDTLIKLTKLNLGGNQITRIENLDMLVNLTSLNLGGNQITRIENLDTLVNLTSLDLSTNQITRIENLDKLVKLTELYLGENQITNINENFVALENILKKIEHLELWHNPIEKEMDIKFAQNNNNLLEIKGFLARYDPENEVQLPAKVMMLGNHYSGKSTFSDYFISENRYFKNSSDPTHILSILQYKKSKSNNVLPEAVIYDFGGHDYYHGIYQAFLTNDSINCLFWQQASDINILDDIKTKNVDEKHKTYYFSRQYWLYQLKYAYELIGHTKENESQPVFIVQTRADKDKKHQTFENYVELYIENEFFVALVDEKEQSESIKEKNKLALEYFEKSLKVMIESKRKKLGVKSWYIELLNYIYNYNSEKSITIKEIKAKNNPEKVEDKKYRTLLDQLCKQGLILYYIDNPKLRDVAWLNPQETVDYIHKLLNKTILIKKKGIVGEREFKKEIKDENIIELLLQNQVIFKDTHRGEYIIPGYLASMDEYSDDYFIFSEYENSNFIMKFEKFIPFGMINRLICHYGKNSDKKTYRRDLLAFTAEGQYKVIIKLDFQNLEIKVRVNSIKSNDDTKKQEMKILNDIISLYWNKNPEEIIKENNKDKDLDSKKDNRSDQYSKDEKERKENKLNKLKPISDLYISVDGKHFINLAFLNDETKDLNEFVYYPLKVETKVIKELVDGKEISKEYKYNIIDRASPKSLSLLPVRHLSTNKKLTGMKKIFISYSKHDEDYLKEFDKHLQNLKKENKIEVYFDKLTDPGEKVHEVIEEKLRDCDFLIVLVSIDSLNTPYINDIEINMAEELGKKIIPIIIKPCEWEYSKLGKYYSTLKGHPLSLNKDLFLNDQIKETTDIERHAWWVEIIKELRTKLFNDKI